MHLARFVSRLIPARISGLGLVDSENVPKHFNVPKIVIARREALGCPLTAIVARFSGLLRIDHPMRLGL